MTNFEAFDFIKRERAEAVAAENAESESMETEDEKGKGKWKKKKKKMKKMNEQMDALDQQIMWHLERTPTAAQTIESVREVLSVPRALGVQLTDEDRLQIVNMMPCTEVGFALVGQYCLYIAGWLRQDG